MLMKIFIRQNVFQLSGTTVLCATTLRLPEPA